MTTHRLVFAGSPAAAVPSLTQLVVDGHDVALVITRPDAKLGRKGVLTPTPVAAEAERLGIPILKTSRLDAAAVEAVAEVGAALGVVVAYGGLVGPRMLATPRLGWINLHFSLLPAWRGAAPVQRAIAAGDAISGVSVFQLVAELDAGDIVATLPEPIGANDTGDSLLARLSEIGAPVLSTAVRQMLDATAVAVPQSGEASHAAKLTRDDGRVRFDAPRAAVDAQIRAVTSEPGAFALVADDPVKVLKAAIPESGTPDRLLSPGELAVAGNRVFVGTVDAPLELIRVQPAGRAAMAARDWSRGRDLEGTVLS